MDVVSFMGTDQIRVSLKRHNFDDKFEVKFT
jgi:hypothetical protein